ncbi:hypothetical protein Tco_1190438 [Tanacetum coccineum]
MSLSSAFIATVALLIIVVIVAVVVVVGRPDSIVLGCMANPLAVTALSVGLACVLPLILPDVQYRHGSSHPLTQL